MYKKIAVLILVLVLLSAALTAAVYANSSGSEQINWRIAGPIFSNIDVTPQNSATQSYTLLSLTASGAPGPAQLQVVGTGIPGPITDLCPVLTTKPGLQIKFTEGGFVALFPDQSMLYFKVDDSEGANNALCVTFDPTDANTGILDYVITGGAGRFEGASGNVTVTLSSWGVTSVLSAEVGEITGTIEGP